MWSSEAEAAFEALKHAMATTPVLALPDFSKEFFIECDASGNGIGAVLSQESHPIAFLSKTLTQRHMALSVYDKEMLAVVFAVQHWRPYLLGHHFTILTDHRTIQHYLEQRITTPAQQKWLLKLIGYDYSIQYRSGVHNVVADALSRQAEFKTIIEQAELKAITGISVPLFSYVQDIHIAALNDAATRQLWDSLKAGSCLRKQFSLQSDRIFYQNHVYVPDVDNWRMKLMREFHCGEIGGHSGWLRTHKRLYRNFAWPNMKNQLKKFVAECIVCQQNHYEATFSPGLLQPNPIPAGAWQDISMDFVEGLPKADGKSVIMVIVDRFTKYAHFVPLAHPYTAKVVSEAFVANVFKLHACMECLRRLLLIEIQSFLIVFGTHFLLHKVLNCAKVLLIILTQMVKQRISIELWNIISGVCSLKNKEVR